MFKETLKVLFERDLNKLKKEIESYQDEANMWEIKKGINNSGGNLCLHLIGNLKTYIGLGLAGIAYERQREREFSAKNIERHILLTQIDETIEVVVQGLDTVEDTMLYHKYPVKIWKEETEMAFTLIHLHAHLNHHLGQINYHRRLLDH